MDTTQFTHTLDDNEEPCWSCAGTAIGDPHYETRCTACAGTGLAKENDLEDRRELLLD